MCEHKEFILYNNTGVFVRGWFNKRSLGYVVGLCSEVIYTVIISTAITYYYILYYYIIIYSVSVAGEETLHTYSYIHSHIQDTRLRIICLIK